MNTIPLCFGKDETGFIKGLAILFMLIHHVLIPEFYDSNIPALDMDISRWVMRSMKICVGLFTFLVGYGYAFAPEKKLKHSVTRISRFLLIFWSILLFVCLPIAVLGGGYCIDIGNIVYNMFGLQSNLNWVSWYVYFYIYAMLLLPVVAKLIDKRPVFYIAGLIILAYLIEVTLSSIPNSDKNVFLKAAFSCMLYTPTLLCGYLMAHQQIYRKIHVNKKRQSVLFILILALLILTARGAVGAIFGLNLDFIYVPILIFCILAIFSFFKITIVRNILRRLGSASMYMWFLHALFFTQLTRAFFQPIILWPQNIFLIIIWVVILSYLLAIFTQRIVGLFETAIRKMQYIGDPDVRK